MNNLLDRIRAVKAPTQAQSSAPETGNLLDRIRAVKAPEQLNRQGLPIIGEINTRGPFVEKRYSELQGEEKTYFDSTNPYFKDLNDPNEMVKFKMPKTDTRSLDEQLKGIGAENVGVGAGTRALGSLATNEHARIQYFGKTLQEKYGKPVEFGVVKRNGAEQLVFKNPETGKYNFIDPEGNSLIGFGDIVGDVADVAGEVFPIAGGLAGGIAGAVGGLAGAAGGAGIGAGVAQTGRQELAKALGVQTFETTGEYLKPIIYEAAMAGGGEVVGAVAIKILKQFKSGTSIPGLTAKQIDEAINRAGGEAVVAERKLSAGQVLSQYGDDNAKKIGAELLNAEAGLAQTTDIMRKAKGARELGLSTAVRDKVDVAPVAREEVVAAGRVVQGAATREQERLAAETANAAETNRTNVMPEQAGSSLRDLTERKGGEFDETRRSDLGLINDQARDIGLRVDPESSIARIMDEIEYRGGGLVPELVTENRRLLSNLYKGLNGEQYQQLSAKVTELEDAVKASDLSANQRLTKLNQQLSELATQRDEALTALRSNPNSVDAELASREAGVSQLENYGRKFETDADPIVRQAYNAGRTSGPVPATLDELVVDKSVRDVVEEIISGTVKSADLGDGSIESLANLGANTALPETIIFSGPRGSGKSSIGNVLQSSGRVMVETINSKAFTKELLERKLDQLTLTDTKRPVRVLVLDEGDVALTDLAKRNTINELLEKPQYQQVRVIITTNNPKGAAGKINRDERLVNVDLNNPLAKNAYGFGVAQKYKQPSAPDVLDKALDGVTSFREARKIPGRTSGLPRVRSREDGLNLGQFPEQITKEQFTKGISPSLFPNEQSYYQVLSFNQDAAESAALMMVKGGDDKSFNAVLDGLIKSNAVEHDLVGLSAANRRKLEDWFADTTFKRTDSDQQPIAVLRVSSVEDAAELDNLKTQLNNISDMEAPRKRIILVVGGDIESKISSAVMDRVELVKFTPNKQTFTPDPAKVDSITRDYTVTEASIGKNFDQAEAATRAEIARTTKTLGETQNSLIANINETAEGKTVDFSKFEQTLNQLKDKAYDRNLSPDFKSSLNMIADAMRQDIDDAWQAAIKTARDSGDTARADSIESWFNKSKEVQSFYRDGMNLLRRDYAERIIRPSPAKGTTDGVRSYELSDAEVFDVVTKPGASRQFDTIIKRESRLAETDELSTETATRIREATRQRWYDLVVKDGNVDLAAAKKFDKEYREALSTFFTPGELSMFSKPVELKRALDVETARLSSANTMLEEAFDARIANTKNPLAVFDTIWKSGFKGDISRLRSIAREYPELQLEDKFKRYVVSNLQDNIIKAGTLNDPAVKVDAEAIRSWIKTNKDMSDELFGQEYAKGLEELADWASAVNRTGKNQSQPIDSWLALVFAAYRGSFGVLTSQGRRMTAVKYAGNWFSERSMARSLSDPVSIAKYMKLKERLGGDRFKSVLGQAMARTGEEKVSNDLQDLIDVLGL